MYLYIWLIFLVDVFNSEQPVPICMYSSVYSGGTQCFASEVDLGAAGGMGTCKLPKHKI